MASVNKVIIVGNLGRDPEMRTFPSGDRVANVTIATTDKWKDKNSGEMKEATEWHRVVFNGRLAEIAGEYLKKGRPVYVEGRLKTRKWQDKEGKDVYTTEVIAENMQLLGGREGMGGPGGGDEDGGGLAAEAVGDGDDGGAGLGHAAGPRRPGEIGALAEQALVGDPDIGREGPLDVVAQPQAQFRAPKARADLQGRNILGCDT